jgi:uncharacterized protein YbjT (DUF2867 family)
MFSHAVDFVKPAAGLRHDAMRDKINPMSTTSVRTIFIAGAAGATGTAIAGLPRPSTAALRPHLRPARAAAGHLWAGDPNVRVGELGDAAWLDEALDGCTGILQLIGTMRRRFARGDTYETSDIGTTRSLVAAASRSGKIDHIVLLSSVGAGRPLGAYLKAKASAEALVRDSGIAWTIFRPSSFDGGPHRAPPGMASALGLLGRLGAQETADRFRPVALDRLAGGLLTAATERGPLNTVLEGSNLQAWLQRCSMP